MLSQHRGSLESAHGPILLSHLWQGESAKSQELLPRPGLSSNPHPVLAPSRVSVSVGLSEPRSQGEWQGGVEVTLQDGEWRKGGVTRILICFSVQGSNPGVRLIRVLGILGDGNLCFVGFVCVLE